MGNFLGTLVIILIVLVMLQVFLWVMFGGKKSMKKTEEALNTWTKQMEIKTAKNKEIVQARKDAKLAKNRAIIPERVAKRKKDNKKG